MNLLFDFGGQGSAHVSRAIKRRTIRKGVRKQLRRQLIIHRQGRAGPKKLRRRAMFWVV